MQKEWDIERAELTAALENESRQVARLSGYLARCKADLAVAESQIEELAHHGRMSARQGRPRRSSARPCLTSTAAPSSQWINVYVRP